MPWKRSSGGLRERESALKNEALILAANPASPLALCRSLALEAYRRMVSGEEGEESQELAPRCGEGP